ncbi:hypothetical protein GCM10010174_87750 [Kutzneria viridogrisea]|uniref:Pimeloyl-ACP methyl ester carboxylesterase n=1 Tax=Kutzneria viridogrisea TaxID=47990 RepID=A0ABR6BXR8_9PSEU|nr:pimeloyl-ACP methyl ester carboxylesterase [Kutzneria viridogrisea]
MVIRWRSHGRGSPVTLIAPGLGATEGEARIPASGLSGTRVVATLPSHGDAPDAPDDYWSYSRIAADLLGVADEIGASRAIGTSLGAGALTSIAAAHPHRFDRLVLLLPAALDRPRAPAAMWSYERLADAAQAGDVRELRELVAAEVPTGMDVGDHVDRRTAALLRLSSALRAIPEQVPVADATQLSSVAAPVLVIGAVGDPLHPEQVAKDVARAFPAAHLELFDSAAPLITHRKEIRSLLVDFLAG